MTPLLKLELRHLVRQPLTWAVLAILFFAMLAASATGVARVRGEQATHARIAVEQQQAIARAKDATRRYGQPGDLVIPVFRDPTDAYSYFYNFMMLHAIRTPAPLAAITTGQSDLQPSNIRLNMSAVFPDTAYELRSPRSLALGAFDLGFVLVYLVPLAMIALAGASLTREQDSGVLRLIAAQPIAPRRVAAAKFGALALLLAPLVAAGVAIALLASGAIASGSGGGVAVLAALVALYVAFWIALCALIASFWKGSVASLAALVVTWAVMTLLVPAAGALLLDAVDPAPSRLAYIDKSRALADQVPSGWEDRRRAARWLAGRTDLGPVTADASERAEAGRLARDAFFRTELGPQRDAFAEHGRRLASASDALRLLSPASMLDGGLQALAGTDMASQLAFTAAADRYAGTLRAHFEPLIVANIGRERPCAACPGRLNFAAYDSVPTFPSAANSSTGLGRGGLIALYLLLVTLLAGGLAARRFRSWPN